MVFETYKMMEYSDVNSSVDAGELVYKHGYDWILKTLADPSLSYEKKERFKESLSKNQDYKTNLFYEEQARRISTQSGIEISPQKLQDLMLNDYSNAVKEAHENRYDGFLSSFWNFASDFTQGLVYESVNHPLKTSANIIMFGGMEKLLAKSASTFFSIKKSHMLDLLSGVAGDNLIIGLEELADGADRNHNLRQLGFPELDGGISISSIRNSFLIRGVFGAKGIVSDGIKEDSFLRRADLKLTTMFKENVLDTKTYNFFKDIYKKGGDGIDFVASTVDGTTLKYNEFKEKILSENIPKNIKAAYESGKKKLDVGIEKLEEAKKIFNESKISLAKKYEELKSSKISKDVYDKYKEGHSKLKKVYYTLKKSHEKYKKEFNSKYEEYKLDLKDADIHGKIKSVYESAKKTLGKELEKHQKVKKVYEDSKNKLSEKFKEYKDNKISKAVYEKYSDIHEKHKSTYESAKKFYESKKKVFGDKYNEHKDKYTDDIKEKYEEYKLKYGDDIDAIKKHVYDNKFLYGGFGGLAFANYLLSGDKEEDLKTTPKFLVDYFNEGKIEDE